MYQGREEHLVASNTYMVQRYTYTWVYIFALPSLLNIIAFPIIHIPTVALPVVGITTTSRSVASGMVNIKHTSTEPSLSLATKVPDFNDRNGAMKEG